MIEQIDGIYGQYHNVMAYGSIKLRQLNSLLWNMTHWWFADWKVVIFHSYVKLPFSCRYSVGLSRMWGANQGQIVASFTQDLNCSQDGSVKKKMGSSAVNGVQCCDPDCFWETEGTTYRPRQKDLDIVLSTRTDWNDESLHTGIADCSEFLGKLIATEVSKSIQTMKHGSRKQGVSRMRKCNGKRLHLRQGELELSEMLDQNYALLFWLSLRLGFGFRVFLLCWCVCLPRAPLF